MSLVRKIKRALRGDIGFSTVLLEAGRRGRAAVERRRERALVTKAGGDFGPARLKPEFARMSAAQLLQHFRSRRSPRFLPGFEEASEGQEGSTRKPDSVGVRDIIARAEAIVSERRWPLLGYGEQNFSEQLDWLRDPVSGVRWQLDYHADVALVKEDASDIRVVWELNRLSHLVTLGCAYAVTRDGRFAAECLWQTSLWRTHNPTGFGPNWTCAMEVALRAVNLLAVFQLLRHAPELNEARLQELLGFFDEHGAHIRRNLEFSHIATSNHYLSDVAGLLWLGICLPELREASEWRAFALRELSREMDKQVLADGADGEASTGYHRFVTELFLYTFLLCRANDIEIEERYWRRLRAMLEYIHSYVRPDGRAPLIGDTDSGQFLPITPRAADEHSYVAAIGAVVFGEPRFKFTDTMPTEVFWMTGEAGVRAFAELQGAGEDATLLARSAAFADAGTYVLRDRDLYMLFNASGAGLGGRGSHAHNDALAIEVSACGASFIRDPGTYVYTADLRERHLFRSTAFHSTVEVDGAQQCVTELGQPFVIGDEAHPRVLDWESDEARDIVVAEHDGYARLAAGAVKHRRTVLFDKRARYWLVKDALTGAGEHAFRFVFHFAPGTETSVRPDACVVVCDRITGARLFVISLEGRAAPALEPRFSSRDYGAKEESQAACWTMRAPVPLVARWALVPVGANETEEKCFKLIESLKTDVGGGMREVFERPKLTSELLTSVL